MTKRPSINRLWSALFLVTGATALIASVRVTQASERITPEVLAARKALPSVGNIHTEKSSNPSTRVFESEKAKKINGMGTGIVIDERGYMVTNYHVIADVDTIRVEFEDDNQMKSSFMARKIRFDKEHDLALIKVEAPAKSFKVMPLGTSSDLMLCEKVIAIGNAYGYIGTTTLGYISALGRDVDANDTVSYKNLIQTDAAINPGNSGGPLVNMDGEVIGINVAIRANANKIGFAIPIDDARRSIKNMINIEHLDLTYHGLITKDVKSGATRMCIIEGTHPESPAAAAGVRSGDVIIRVGHVDVIDGVDLERAFLHRAVGDRIDLTFKRNDKLERAVIALASYNGGRAALAANDIQVSPRANGDESDKFWQQLGLKLVALPDRELGQLKKTKYRGGMRVVEVKPDSPSSVNGIQKNDILVGLGNWETLSIDNIIWIMNQYSTQGSGSEGTKIPYFIVRSQETYKGTINMTQAPRTASNSN